MGECPSEQANLLISDSTVVARETNEGFVTYQVTLQDLSGEL